MPGPIDLIKRSFQIFFEKKNLIYFLKIYAPLVPFAVFFYFQDLYLNKYTQNLDFAALEKYFASFGWVPILAIIVGIAYLIISFWISASGIIAVSNVVSGGRTDVRETLRGAWGKLWLFSLLSILVGFLVGLGFVLLIIPGVLFFVWYHFAGYELLTGGKGVGEAMTGSKRLVSGKFWKVFGRFIVFGLFGILVEMVLGFLPFGTGSMIQPLFGALLILPYFLLYRELANA